MIYSVVEIMSDPPFLTLVWIIAIFTAVFTATLELLATIWVIAELRTQLHKLKVQRRRQTYALEQYEQQIPSVRSNVITSPSHPTVNPVVRRRTRSLRNPNQRSNDWN